MSSSVKAYMLRRIPSDLWTAVKQRAESEGRDVRFVLLAMLRIYADHGFHVVETFQAKRKP